MAIDRPDHEIHLRRKGTNRTLGLILGSFVLLVFAVTVVKLSTNEAYRGEPRTPGASPTIVVIE